MDAVLHCGNEIKRHSQLWLTAAEFASRKPNIEDPFGWQKKNDIGLPGFMWRIAVDKTRYGSDAYPLQCPNVSSRDAYM